jgi:hypothetical protein
MRVLCWGFYLWPGLPQLWTSGRWQPLAIAAAFALAINSILATTWVWTDVLSVNALRGLWVSIALGWILLHFFASRFGGARAVATSGEAIDLFRSALTEYLQGNWAAAQAMCRKLVARNPRDPEVLLLLASVFRRSGQTDEARAQLTALLRLEAAAAWKYEIGVEFERIVEREQEAATAGAGPDEALPIAEAA